MMASREDALAIWERLLNQYQVQGLYRTALTGDGSGASSADVANKAGWAWVRYDEKQDKVSQVVNWRFPGIPEEVPVIVGKQFPTDRYYQILGINFDVYIQHITGGDLTSYIVPAHGETHIASGADPALIDTKNLVFGRVKPTAPTSLSVEVTGFYYDNNGTFSVFETDAIDLTSYVPATANRHRYVAVTLSADTGALAATEGEEYPVALPPALPEIALEHVPLAAVLLEYGDTTIVDGMIYDMRIFMNIMGGYIKSTNEALAVLEAEWDYAFSRHLVNGT